MIRVLPVDHRGVTFGDPRNLQDKEAHDLVMAARAMLCPRQPEPPWVFLKEAERSLQRIDRVGWPATRKVLSLVTEKLLPGNVRQTTLEGMHVPWAHSSSRAEVAFRKALMGPDGPTPGLQMQLGGVLADRSSKKKPVILEREPLEEEIAALGLIEVPDRQMAEWTGEWRCYGIGPDWLAFMRKVLSISAQLNDALASAIHEGRVLVVEELFPGGRLLHPERWKSETYDPTNHPNDWFLLTRDLPDDWFESGTLKPAKLGRPKGSGGYAKADSRFVDLILERLVGEDDVTVHGVVTEIVERHDREIPGASYEAKVRRLMRRIEDVPDPVSRN